MKGFALLVIGLSFGQVAAVLLLGTHKTELLLGVPVLLLAAFILVLFGWKRAP